MIEILQLGREEEDEEGALSARGDEGHEAATRAAKRTYQRTYGGFPCLEIHRRRYRGRT